VITASPAKAGPERMCAGCRRRAPQAELIRLVRRDTEGWSLDLEGVASGRAHYVHARSDCWRRFQRAQRRRMPPAFGLSEICSEIVTLRMRDSELIRRHGWVDAEGNVKNPNRVTKRLEKWDNWGKSLSCAWSSDRFDVCAERAKQESTFIGRGFGA